MKPIYIIFLFIALTVGLIYQVFLPLYTGEASFLYTPSSGYKTLKQNTLDYQATLDQAAKIIDQSKKLQDTYKTITETDIDLLKTMVPDSISKVKLHSEMASMLTSEGFPSDKLGLTSKSTTVVPGTGAYAN